jgi:hypothetical protein
MIQTKGTINIGLANYTDPLLNVYFGSATKFTPSQGIAQVGTITVNEKVSTFNAVANVGTYNYEGANPSFDAIQNAVLAGLATDYPTCTFSISE